MTTKTETIREIEMKSQLLLQIIITLVDEVGLLEKVGDFHGALALVPTIRKTLLLCEEHLELLVLLDPADALLIRGQVIERTNAALARLQQKIDAVQAQVDQRTAVCS